MICDSYDIFFEFTAVVNNENNNETECILFSRSILDACAMDEIIAVLHEDWQTKLQAREMLDV